MRVPEELAGEKPQTLKSMKLAGLDQSRESTPAVSMRNLSQTALNSAQVERRIATMKFHCLRMEPRVLTVDNPGQAGDQAEDNPAVDTGADTAVAVHTPEVVRPYAFRRKRRRAIHPARRIP